MSVIMDYDPPLFEAPDANEFVAEFDSDDRDYVDAKAYLLEASTETGVNL